MRAQAAVNQMHFAGRLPVYDVALRIGAFLKVLPERVYLQSGARKGARALGLDATQRSLPMSAFPPAFHRLEPWEVEDVLCIYKRELGRLDRAKRDAA